MKNKLILAIALMAFTFNGFSQAPVVVAEQQAPAVSPLSSTLLDFLKCIKMENINKSWTNSAQAWMTKAMAATSATEASALMKELSTVVSNDAFTNDFKSNKTKWSQSAEKVRTMPELKTSMKNLAAGFNASAFIPEFNMAEWTARVDAL